MNIVNQRPNLVEFIVTNNSIFFNMKFLLLLCYFFKIKQRLLLHSILRLIVRVNVQFVQFKHISNFMLTLSKKNRQSYCQ